MIIKDSFYQISSNILSAIILFIFIILITRNIGPTEFGRYQFAVTFGMFIGLIQDFGFKNLIFREYAKPSDKLKKNYYKIFSTAFFHALILTFFIILIIQFFPKKRLLSLTVIFYGINTIFLFISSYLKGNGKFEIEAKWNFIFKIFTVIFVIVFLPIIKLNSYKIFILSIIGGLIPILYFLSKLHKNLKISFSNFTLTFYKYCYNFFIIDFFTQIYFRSDIFLLTYFKGFKENGFYSANCKIIEGILFLISPIIFIFFQRLRKKYNNLKKFKIIFLKFLLVSFIIAIFFSSFGFFSGLIIKILYGKNFILGMNSLKILFLALFFMIINFLLTQTLISLNEEEFYARIAIFLAILNVSLNFLFIPKMGANGAAISKLIIEIILTLLIYMKLNKIWKNI